VAVDEAHRDRLDDADAAGTGDRSDELRVAARVNRAVDQRHADADTSLYQRPRRSVADRDVRATGTDS
jgi:hypothetical protein